MPEIILPYDKAVSPQERVWSCGPGALQIVLNGRGIFRPEMDLLAEVEALENPGRGDDQDGTDHISLLTSRVNFYLKSDAYAVREIPNDPPSRDQIELLWADIHFSVASGYGAIANIVVPPSNYPRGTRGSRSPSYGDGTVKHYIAIMGIYDGPDGRHLLIADSGFAPYEYWVSLEQLATMIPPKGYMVFLDRKPSPMPNPVPIPNTNYKTIVDTGMGYPSPDELRSAGHGGIMLYVSGSRPGSNFGGKKLTRDILHMYINAGIACAPVWQYGKPGGTAPSDFTRGYEGGKADALAARKKWIDDCDGPGWTPFYFAVDEDVVDEGKLKQVYEYFRGVNDAIGRQWTGAYGSKGVLGKLISRGLLGQNSEGKFWAWQPSNWNGAVPDSRITLFQRIIDTESRPGPKVGGIRVDVNDILSVDWGQTGIDRKPIDTPPPIVPPQEASVSYTPLPIIDWTNGSPNHSGRRGAVCRLGVIHTQQGKGTARSLAAYLKNPSSGVSYHYAVDNNEVVQVVPLDRAAWSVLDANPYTVNLCFAGSFVEWSTQQWIDNMGRGIEMAAWLMVRDAKTLGFEPRTIGWGELASGKSGITDHWGITGGLRIGNHTDVGSNFPWGLFISHIERFARGVVVAPVVSAIDTEYADNKDFLGKELFPGEKSCPDGIGKYKHYENGSIYWTPTIGAKTMSKFIFDEWAKRGYEAGELGYPTGDFAILAGGHVQGFERGTLYRRDGAERGYNVHGLIYAHWRRSGYELGPFGWPTSDEQPMGRGKVQWFENGPISWPNNPTIGYVVKDGADTPIPDIPEKP